MTTTIRSLCAIGAVGLLALMTACGEGPPTVGLSTDFNAVCDRANDGHRVAVHGYLRLPDSMEVIRSDNGDSVSKAVVVQLFETAQYAGTPIGINLDFGSTPNTMQEIPGEYIYTDDDLKVHLADGELATYGDRVKVSGTVYFGSGDTDFSCGLRNPLVEGG